MYKNSHFNFKLVLKLKVVEFSPKKEFKEQVLVNAFYLNLSLYIAQHIYIYNVHIHPCKFIHLDGHGFMSLKHALATFACLQLADMCEGCCMQGQGCMPLSQLSNGCPVFCLVCLFSPPKDELLFCLGKRM